MRWSRPLLPLALLLTSISFAAPAHATPADSVFQAPYLERIGTVPPEPCAGRPVGLVVSGRFTDGCGRLLGDDRGRMLVAVSPNPECSPACPTVMTPWADTLALGVLAAGRYRIQLTYAVVDPCGAAPDTAFYFLTYEFSVASVCVGDPDRFIDLVAIGGPGGGPACEGESLRVVLAGHFPNGCFTLRKVDRLPTLIVGPYPQPDVLRLVFDDQCCAEMICPPGPTPWTTTVMLPPLPAGGYGLSVHSALVCCRDSVGPGDPQGDRVVPFGVASVESCGVMPRCLRATWDHGGRVGGCDTGFDADGHASLTLGLVSTVALAGVQGRFDVMAEGGAPGGLIVTGLEPVGPAAGMHLTWTPVATGATFVLFADSGAPIPAFVPGSPPPPILRVTLARPMTAGGFAADSTRRWFVHAGDLLGADARGQGVGPCPVRDPDGLLEPVATVCVAGACDVDRDGRTDVRDLVRMVRCLRGDGPCPPDSLGTLDCEGDADFDLADVLCCARVVIGLPPRHGPGDSTRAEPRIAVSFGAPVRVADGIDVPVRVDGVDRIGAARLRFRLPEHGIASASLTPARTAPDWLVLDAWATGSLDAGLIALGPPGPTFAPPPTTLDLTLHLGLPAGAVPGGQVALEQSDLSGPDGIALVTDFGAPVASLDGGATLTLDPARPNPFGDRTTLRLTLDAAATVEVAVYDLAGRRLAVLHSGPMALGVHALGWDGRTEAGGRVPSGVYFVRAGLAGRPVTVQKLVMVRGD